MASLQDLRLWESLDAELLSLYDHFTNIMRAAQVPEEEGEQTAFGREKEKKAPGDLLEVWAEKLVYSGFTSLHLLSQLKKAALLGDVNSLVSNVRVVRTAFEQAEDATNGRLSTMRQEVAALLGQLEASYFSSQHRGRLITGTGSSSQELKELCQLALECGNSASNGSNSGAAAAPAERRRA